MSADPALQAQLRDMMSKARRSLNAAQRHLKDGDYDFAASRSYYAAFYAMEAALLSQGIACSTHASAISAFSERFIKTGILPTSFGAQTTRLFRERQIGDYEFDVSVSAESGEQAARTALEVVDAVTRHLRTSGFLPAP